MAKYFKYIFIFVLFIAGFTARQAFANTCVLNASGAWSTAGTWTSCGGVAPTAADNVQLTGSFNLTVTGTSNVGRSLDATGFTGTMAVGSAATLNLGDSTVGLSNIGLKLDAGMTFNASSTATINFISSVATTTQSTITTAGKTLPNVTIGSASVGGNYAITDNTTLDTASILTVTKGELHTDGATDNSGLTHTWGRFNSGNTNVRAIYLGTSNITVNGVATTPWRISLSSGLTFSGASSTINCTGAGTNGTAYFFGGIGASAVYGTVNLTGGGTMAIIGDNNFANLTVTGTASKYDALTISGNQTVTGTFTAKGNNGAAGASVNRLLFSSSAVGTAQTLTLTGASINTENIDFKDITFARTDAGGLDLTSGGTILIGDCGGNTRTGGDGTVTLTTGVQLYWKNASGGSWTTAANFDTNPSATSRIPLPQDDVSFNAAAGSVNLNSAAAITMDMPRVAKTLDFTGMTFSGIKPTFLSSLSPSTAYFFGSLIILDSTKLGVGGFTSNIVLESRGNYYIDTQGQTIGSAWAVTQGSSSNTMTLLAAFSDASLLSINSGTFNSGSYNVTATGVVLASNAQAIVNAGSGTWTVTGTGNNTWGIGVLATFNADTSTVIVSNTTATAKNFAGGGENYNIVTFSGDNITISDSNFFNTLNINNAGLTNGLKFGAGTTSRVVAFATNGSAGNLAKISSSVGGSPFTLSTQSNQISVDYMSIQDSVVTQSSTWYAGINSSNVSGNIRWIFAVPPGPAVRQSGTSDVKTGGGVKLKGGVIFR